MNCVIFFLKKNKKNNVVKHKAFIFVKKNIDVYFKNTK